MSTAQREHGTGEGLAILVADDDPIFRQLLASRLQPLASSIIEAEDGEVAWQQVRTHTFDLAIVDFDMPNLNGVALIQCLRGHPRTRHMPIVMCTSRQDAAAMCEAIEAGASSFLNKPLNWSLFERHIGHLLRLSQAAAQANGRIDRLEATDRQKDALVSALRGEITGFLREARRNAPIPPAALSDAVSRLEATLGHFAASYDTLPSTQPGSTSPVLPLPRLDRRTRQAR